MDTPINTGLDLVAGTFRGLLKIGEASGTAIEEEGFHDFYSCGMTGSAILGDASTTLLYATGIASAAETRITAFRARASVPPRVVNTPKINLETPRPSATPPKVEPPLPVKKGNYAKNFKAVSDTPAGAEVHHTLFQKYEADFAARGINIHEPRFLRGVDPKVHSRITTSVSRLERTLGRRLTVDEILDLVVKFDKEFKGLLVPRTKPPAAPAKP